MTDYPGGEGHIDHLAVAVRDLDGAVDQFSRLLGFGPVWQGESQEQAVRIAMFNFGQTKLELIEGTGSDSKVAGFVEKRDEGLHHICFAVENLKATLERLDKEGFEIIGSGDDIGVEGRPVAFVHPGSSRGVLIEFIESDSRNEE